MTKYGKDCIGILYVRIHCCQAVEMVTVSKFETSLVVSIYRSIEQLS